MRLGFISATLRWHAYWWSKRHCFRYVAEYEHRQNTMGLNGILAIGRLLEQAVGKRLTYEGLVATTA